MKKLASLALGAVLGFTPLFALAADFNDLQFSYDKQTRLLSIEGIFGKKEHEACTVYIYDSDTASGEFDGSFVPDFADISVTGSEGAFKYECVLPDSYESDEYILKISSAADSWQQRFMYVNEDTVSALLPQINSAKNADALGKILESESVKLGIGDEDYKTAGSDMAEILYLQKPSGGFEDAPELINMLDQSMAAALLKNGCDASLVLRKYAKAISVDFEKDYAQYDANVKKSIDSELKNTDYTGGLLEELYPEIRCVGFIKSAGTWQALKNAFYGVDESGNKIATNFDVINPDMTVFDRIENKDNVFAAMFRRRSELVSIKKIRCVFEECAEEIYDSEQNDGNGKGSSGGGGGGGAKPVSGNVSIDPGYVSQISPAQPFVVFNDIQKTDWYYVSVEKLYSLSLINGYEDGSFRPDNPITRAEYTKLITAISGYLGFDLESDDVKTDFSDVTESDWFYEAVTKAASSGLVMGSDGRFSPDEKITRQDASVIAFRLASLKKEISGLPGFSDNGDIAEYACNAVGALCDAGIISGMGDGRFAPLENLTRAQAAKLLCGLMEYLD